MSGGNLLNTADLTMRFGGVVAVDQVNFSMDAGELRCLIGPNGAGKSTFFKCLIGQLRPTAGLIEYKGQDISSAEPHEIARQGIAIKTQVPSLFDGLTVRENIRLSARRVNNRALTLEKVDEVLELTQLTEESRQIAGQLPHGQRQWLELGVVIASDPELMLLDEPTAGMTHQEVEQTAELIDRISDGRSLIVVEHDMQFIRMIAKTVTVFHQGKILVEDTMEKISKNQMVRDVYLGKQA
ncbi:MAG: ABC transporter ATP-binding protein [Chloroflexi bacterium]|nr:ABC transporter ATP-binding protein [Chloroflexota bacterium]|tara:strand:- start:2546 stop:3265 length:720 start_codon:yes stop_codon:yes gene_type:complete